MSRLFAGYEIRTTKQITCHTNRYDCKGEKETQSWRDEFRGDFRLAYM